MPDPDFLHCQVARILDASGIGLKMAKACGETVASDIAPDGSAGLEHALDVKMLIDI